MRDLGPIRMRILSSFCHFPSSASSAPISKYPVAMSKLVAISRPLLQVPEARPARDAVVDDEELAAPSVARHAATLAQAIASHPSR